MAEHNPECWTTDQWRQHKSLMDAGGLYARRIHDLNDQRHAWAAEQVAEEIGGRNMSHGMRIKMRREYNATARLRFPAPDPEIGGGRE